MMRIAGLIADAPNLLQTRRSGRVRCPNLASTLVLVIGLIAANVGAAPTPSASASAEVGPTERELPPLPAVPKPEPAPAAVTESEELDALLEHLVSDNADERTEALHDVLEVRPKLLSALLLQLDKLAARTDRERMKRALAQVRDKSNRAPETSDPGGTGASATRTDLLKLLLDKPRPKDEGWRDLTELVAVSRMLTAIGNVHAARGLIEIYVRFGEFMRVDVQNRLYDLKDGAVAALIETRRHRAEKIAHFADRQLDRLGKGVPGEAIRTESFEILADVLRAYGRVKDPDAARIIISYANSERYQVREAARQAIVMLGEVGIWQLREAFENIAGKRPRRDWSWERTARELFFEYDRLHVVKAYELLDKGRLAAEEKRFEEMAEAYDSLLARSPQFDKAATLAPGYFEYAQRIAQQKPEVAKAALVRVERLASDTTLRQRARSLRETLEASELAQRGIVDAYVLNRALEQDPANQSARRLLASGDQALIDAQAVRTRWLTSGAIGLVALGAILFVLVRPRGSAKAKALGGASSPADAGTDIERAATKGEPRPSAPGSSQTAATAAPAPVESAHVTVESTHAAAEPASGDAPDPLLPKRRDPFEDL
ncbi:MAG TPA: hypothetical protein VIV60_03300 [Polyangiaceae bacterium]